MKFKKLLLNLACFATLSATAQVPGYIPTASLAAHYSFDNTLNSSIGTFHGTNSGNITFVGGRTAATGNAAYFDGASYVSISTVLGNFGTGDFTVNAWINKESISGAIFSKRNIPSHGNFLTLSAYVGFEIDEIGVADYIGYLNPAPAALSTWTMATVVRSGNMVSLYENGNLITTENIGVTHNINNSAETRIGSRTDGAVTDEYFQGTIDDLSVWNRALTSGEITAMAICTVSGSTVVTDASCFGLNNGAINLTPSGGTGPYTYNWLPSGPTTQDRTGLVAGTYTVEVTDANGCVGTVTATVGQPATPISGTTVVTNVACFGGNTGAINLTPTGGTGPYTYNWLPSGPTTEDRTGLAVGTYSVQVTDATGCVGTVTRFVSQPTSAVSGTTVVTNVACFGGSNGAINLTPTGGTGPYTYNWLPSGPTTEDRTGLVAGTYTVQITDVNGCAATVTASVTQPTSPVSGTTVITNVSCFGGSNGSVNLTPSGGTGPYTYNWLPSGPTTEDRTGLVAGTYTVIITDNNGCTGTVNPSVTQPASPVSGTTVVTNVSCFGGSNGAINLTPTGGSGPYTYNWLPSGPTTEDRTGLVAGTYSVQVTDQNGCVGTVTASVTQPTFPVSGSTVVTNVACFGGSTGAINLTPMGGTGPYTFNWAFGPTTEDRTGLVAGNYPVQITDANACTGTINVSVTQPTSPVSGTTVVTNVACFGGNTGAINLTPTGGTGPYTYNWLPSGPTTEDRTGLVAGTYTVQITDLNGCVATVTATLNQPASAVSGTTVVTNIACFGGSTGAINLTPSGGTGPYTFNWLPTGPTTEDRTGLVAGTYTVVVTDINGCTGTITASVTQPASAVSGTTVVTNVSCFAGSNGAINLTPTGGTGPYTFNWLPSGPTTEDRTGLAAGTYTVQITDLDGCTGTVTASVNQPTSPVSGTTVVTNVGCFGGSTGAINLTPTGGTGPYTFNWLPSGPTTEDRTGLVAGTYTVVVTDNNGCTATVTASVNQPTSPVSGTTVVTNVACFGGSTGAINLTAAGGTGPYTFNWGGGITTEDRTGLTAGTYTVIITDNNGCPATVITTVNQPPTAVSGTTVVTGVSCFGGSNGTINLTAAGGTGPYTFNWLPSGPTTEDRTGLAAGTYTVQITDQNGCTATVTASVTQPTSPVAGTTVVTNVGCFGGSTGAINLTPAGGTGPYTFNWLPSGPTTEDRTGLVAGTYSVQITDQNGCTAIVTASVTEPTSPVSGTTVVTNVACFGGSTGAINLTPAGGTGPYTFNWGGSVTTEDRTGLSAGTYTVNITDNNGCTATVTASVNEPSSAVSGTTVVTSVACFGGSTGAIDLTPSGGTAPYTFDWGSSITSEDLTGIPAGTYSVIITDMNGCSVTVSAAVNGPASDLSVSISSSTNVSCFGGANGSAGTAVTGGTGTYTYLWSNGETTSSVSGLIAGTYTVTVGDDNTCTSSAVVTITEPAALATTTLATAVTCNGLSNGEATVIVSGGTAGYSYLWSNGQTNATATSLAAGAYSVTVTDANGCSATDNVNVSEPIALTSFMMSTNVSCNGGSNGDAMVMTAGGTPTYTYLWSDGQTTETAINLSAGTYTVLVTDANGCQVTNTVTITQPAPLIVNTMWNNNLCFGAANGDAMAMVMGGTGTYDYLWSDGQTTQTATGLVAGNYTVTVTDDNGCTASVSITLTEPAAISSNNSVTICSGASITVGSSTYTTSGVYTDVLTTANGCDSTVTTNLTVNPTATLSQSFTICAGNSITVGSSVYSTSGVYTDVLSTYQGCDSTVTTNLTVNPVIATSQNVSICAGGTFTVGSSVYSTSGTYTDMLTTSSGCDSTVTTTLTVNSLPVVTLAPFSADSICFQTPGILLPAGSPAGGMYSGPGVLPGMFNPSIAGVGVQTVTYTVTDANSCSNSATQNITVLDCTGIDETASSQTVSIYPNPSEGMFTILSENESGEVIVTVTDLAGKIIFTERSSVNGQFMSIVDLSTTANGVYLVRVQSSKGVRISKLILN